MKGSAQRKKLQPKLRITPSHNVQTLDRRAEITSQLIMTNARRSTVGIHLPLNLATAIVAIRSTATQKTPHLVITTTGSTLTSEIAAKAETRSTVRTRKEDTEETLRADTTGTTSEPAREEKEIPHPLVPLLPATITVAEMIANPTKNQRNSIKTNAATVPMRRETTTNEI